MLISIVTITYNSAEKLERTIKSVIEQSYKNIEYIIVDGGSTDETLNIIESFSEVLKKNNIILKSISEPDEGIADAFNKGIDMCTGTLVGIVNSDDWLEHDAVENIVREYEEGFNIYCGDLKIYEKSQFIKLRRSRPWLILFGMYIMHPTVFVKREVYKNFRFNKNLKISMDYDFILRANRFGKNRIKYIPRTISNMELGGASSHRNDMMSEESLVLKNVLSPPLYWAVHFFKSISSFLIRNRKIEKLLK